ncbi:MAG: cell surface protein SprA, partial [Bacteroidetes bacterium]|nr:cell surface protein SprA [Bacteroidota bacterium]
ERSLRDKNIDLPFEPSYNPKKAGGIFRGLTIDIRPQGNVELTLGGNVQKYDNPSLPKRARTQGGFDFDMNINMNVTGKIGDALSMTIKYNNQTGFSFDNQFKLQYQGQEDDIIQLVEAGNVSFPLQTQLITGAQSLRGIKAQLRFGRLTMTNVVAEQQSQKKSIIVEDGAQLQNFEIKADQYESDKHFFLTQFFRNNYDNSLAQIPNILSQVNIEEIEVWVTNRTGQTNGVRDVVAFQDLGETDPYSPAVHPLAGNTLPDNKANDLYTTLVMNQNLRLSSNVASGLQSQYPTFESVRDYEKTYARLLSSSEYILNRELGYISLQTALQPNQVLGVAFKYTYNGQVYQVGELSRNVPPDSSSASEVLYLKMLRSSSIRPDLPMWDLMMKNIYALGAYQISQTDFRLDIFYLDPGGGLKRFIPKGNLSDQQLIRVMNLDRLNNQGDPQPDGLFDYIPGVTINPQNGRLIFPVVEPFGSHLEQKLIDAGNADLVDDYVFNVLYDSTLWVAQQSPELNRFSIKGKYQGSGGNRIQLGAFQLPENSVTVSLGGIRLTEGQDYTVDYNLGVVTIINEGLLNSGQQIKVDYENNALFGFQQRSLMASRLDYRISDKVFVGGTIMKMKERPFSQKVNLGSDPINNTIMGLDFRMQTDVPFLTRALDKLPIYSTKEMSNISLQGEVAHLRPGHNKFIEQDKEPMVYIDDFEGSSSSYDLKGSPQTWKLASTPKGATDKSGNILFPEADQFNDFAYGFNRAKLSWYNVDPSFFQKSQSPEAVYNNKQVLSNHYVRPIFQSELYPNRDLGNSIDQQVFTFDLNYEPEKRGPYNFEESNSGTVPYSRGVRPDGRLIAPETRWGGIMRGIDNNNFEVANIEYVEFWVMDPFIYNDNSKGGQLYINLGNVSEDILKDSRMLYENGISNDQSLMDSTTWGVVPRAQPLNNAFDNNPDLRPTQDVGFDGLNDDDERTEFQSFLNDVQVDPLPKSLLENDPASDNFTHYLDPQYDNMADIIGRYVNFNNPHGNSPVLEGNTLYAGSNNPDIEDLNRDNSLNETEQYFQYAIDMYPGMDVDNHPYIVSVSEFGPDDFFDEPQPGWKWYQFRIPIHEYTSKVGSIQDFRSIQYVRMFLTNWEDSVTLRFGTLDLVRNQWRTYLYELAEASENLPVDEDATFFNVTQVNVEENSGKEPVNYILPPNILREQGVANNANTLVAQNEQSLAASVCGLKDGDSRAVYKNVNLDFRNYKRVIMDIHANRFPGEIMPQDGALTAFIRFGIDFTSNYYQIETPLVFTPDGQYADNDADKATVWPDANKFDVSLSELTEIKKARNAAGWPKTVPYSATTSTGKIVTIKGIPDLGTLQIVMLGVKNPSQNDPNNPIQGEDNGNAQCGEVWFNEFRLSGLDERPGSAALASLSIKLADLGNVNFSTSMHSIGFGQVDMQVDERYQDRFYSYDFNTNLQLGKFLPAKANIQIPFYGGISQSFSTPEYDPYQLDLTSKEQIASIKTLNEDSALTYKRMIQTLVTRKGFNFTNVRKLPGEKQKRLFFFSPENFGFSYAYNVIEKSDPFVQSDYEQTHLGKIDYAHSLQPKYLYPFKKAIKSTNPFLSIIKDLNVNFFPSTMAFNTQMNRQYGELNLRTLEGDDFTLPTTFNKFFTWDRSYSFKYNPFKSLSIDYNANNAARIDEPFGKIDTKEEKQEIWNNIKRGGRTTMFNQNLNVNYKLPLNKLPFLDFTNTTVSYGSGFNWIAAPLRADADGNYIENPLGNVMSNNQQLRFNTDWNFDKLYSKVPYLKKFTGTNPTAGNKQATQQKRETAVKAREKLKQDKIALEEKLQAEKEAFKDLKAELKIDTVLTKKEKKVEKKTQKEKIKSLRKQIKKKKSDRAQKQAPARILENAIMQPLVSLKKISVSYTEDRSTTVPGYMPDTDFVGLD